MMLAKYCTEIFIMKTNKKLLILGVLLILLVGCTNIRDSSGNVMEQFIISWGDAFPLKQSGYGWFTRFIVWPLSQLFNFISNYTGAFWSIIIGTLLINFVKLKSTINSALQQEKMIGLQPEIEKLNKKYEGRDDQESKMQLAQETQNLYNEHGISMFGPLISLLIQFPIIIAMFQAVQRAASIINGSVLGHSLNGTPKDGFTTGNWVYITIFLTMVILQAGSMLIVPYLKNRKNKTQSNNPQSMMYISLGMITMFAYTWNIGMSIYWAISALTQLLQTLFIHFKYSHE